jgi:tetratricopeptide (TPR) repeat protein
LTALVVVAIVAAGLLAVRARTRAPQPPKLESLGPLAPEIVDIVRQAIAAVEQQPDAGPRWGRLGMVCEANGLPAAARDAYTNATALEAAEAKWWFHRAAVEARLGDVNAAVGDMQRAIDRNPTYAPAFWRLGLWFLDQNRIGEAERAFTRSTEIDPADRAGWTGLARVYLQRTEDERAAGLLERMVAGGSADRYALQLLGTAYRRLGRIDQSASAAQVGATGEPQWSDPWTDEMLSFRRGRAALLKDASAYVSAGQFTQAIAILERLQREKPDDLVLMAHLGQVYVAAGQDADGVALLERVVARDPDRFEAHVDLATGYMHQGDLARARAAVERAISLDAAFAPARETMGLILWREGNARGAVKAFDEAVRLDPRNARALVWMGMVETNEGRTTDALAAFQRAADTDPTDVDAWIGIANAQMNRRDLEAAAEGLKNAQRLQPERPAVKATAERLRTLEAAAAHGVQR